MPMIPNNFKPNNKAKSKFHDWPIPAEYPKSLDHGLRNINAISHARKVKPIGVSKVTERPLREDGLAAKLLQFITDMKRPVSKKEINKQFNAGGLHSNTIAYSNISNRLNFLIQRKLIQRPMPAFYEVYNNE